MAVAAGSRRLGDALVAFALQGHFPDDIAELPPVSETDLGPAIQALASAKDDLEAEIHTINQETKEDVNTWARDAKLLQADIERSKSMANEIVREAEAPQVSGEAIHDAQSQVDFIRHEVQYSQQLHEVLQRIRNVNRLLDDVDRKRHERRVLDALQLLQESRAALDAIGVRTSCRAARLLDLRAAELKSQIRALLDTMWKSLIVTDIEARKFVIHDINQDALTLTDAFAGLEAYKEVDERTEQLWRNLDAAILAPRMDLAASAVPAVKVEADALQLHGQAESSVVALLSDLEIVLVFVAHKLPPDLLQSLSSVMMVELVPRLIEKWLDPAVPPSLTDMDNFQNMIQRALGFCATLKKEHYTGFDEVEKWASEAHLTWLNKCKNNALDMIRTKLTGGIGEPKAVEKVERHMIPLDEGRELAAAGAGAAADMNDWAEGWGDAWDDDNEGAGDGAVKKVDVHTRDGKSVTAANNKPPDPDDGADAWGWDEDDTAGEPTPGENAVAQEDDDSAEAWGWGQDDDVPQEQPAKAGNQGGAQTQKQDEEKRELVLRETYHISSMPEPILQLIFAILEDGASLTRGGSEYEWLASTAPGLFSLPTSVLSLFRATAPQYYSLHPGGGMFLYNDAMFLAEKLTDFSRDWKQRDDLSPRAHSMLRLDNEIKALQTFANRSYVKEMDLQRMVLQDLLGGPSSITEQNDMTSAVDAGTARVRTMATTWEPILARSVWCQAVGSLVDALASRLISDILDMSSIGQEEAYELAKLISSATELDDLFLPSRLMGRGTQNKSSSSSSLLSSAAAAAQKETAEEEGEEVPSTAQYAPRWLRLKFLSEVLQSNLNEVRFLWCESDLSLYFTTEEVVNLVLASFEENARTKETIREIRRVAPQGRGP